MASSLTPEQRQLRSALGAHKSWANTPDRSARTAGARRAFEERFEKQVDPEGALPPDERARRAQHARTEYFLRLAWKSSRARSKAAQARREADRLDSEATAADAELDAAS